MSHHHNIVGSMLHIANETIVSAEVKVELTGSSGISGFLQPAVEISLATNDFSSVAHACRTHSVHNLFVEVLAIESLAFFSCCIEKKKRSSHHVRRNEKK
jgi:hypothetical protein